MPDFVMLGLDPSIIRRESGVWNCIFGFVPADPRVKPEDDAAGPEDDAGG
jgi:hypothetical protein